MHPNYRGMGLAKRITGFAGLLHGKACHTILRSLRFLTNRVPLPPLCRGQNKTPRNTLFINGSTVSTGYSATVEVMHRTSKWGEIRRLACPLRRFLFAAPPNCGGWQRNWIHRGTPRPANPVTCFPTGKVVTPATKVGISLARQGGCKGFIIRGRLL